MIDNNNSCNIHYFTLDFPFLFIIVVSIFSLSLGNFINNTGLELSSAINVISSSLLCLTGNFTEMNLFFLLPFSCLSTKSLVTLQFFFFLSIFKSLFVLQIIHIHSYFSGYSTFYFDLPQKNLIASYKICMHQFTTSSSLYLYPVTRKKQTRSHEWE